MMGLPPPSNLKTEGAHPPSGNPLMYLLDRGGAEKVVTFLNNISQTKQVFFEHINDPKHLFFKFQ
jgi:hypothetical protein